MRNPLVSIVIVNWNGLEDTKLCLEHTRQQTYPEFEIIVVDNNSTDDTAAVATMVATQAEQSHRN